jgi:hypothetical protein
MKRATTLLESCPQPRLSCLDAEAIDQTMRKLIDEYRSRCLWFLRPDYYPQTLEERRWGWLRAWPAR